MLSRCLMGNRKGISFNFIHFWHAPLHYKCTAPNANLQSGRFWASSIASLRESFIDFRSCWVVFIHVVRGRPGGLLQFSKGEAVKICLASDSSDIHAMWPNRERRRAWTTTAQNIIKRISTISGDRFINFRSYSVVSVELLRTTFPFFL